jgi:hypothetical protein
MMPDLGVDTCIFSSEITALDLPEAIPDCHSLCAPRGLCLRRLTPLYVRRLPLLGKVSIEFIEHISADSQNFTR